MSITGIFEELVKEYPDLKNLVYCQECGKCTASCPVVRLFPRYYNPRSLHQRLCLGLSEPLTEVGLWLCVRCFRCYVRCPYGLDLPDTFTSIREFSIEKGHLPDPTEKLREVLRTIENEVPIAAVYGWLCLHLPEARAKGEKISKADGLIVDALERFLEERKKKRAAPTSGARRERIAILGSSPTGLTAAHDLAKMGYVVTIFEAISKASVIDKRLPQRVLDVDIDYIKSLGVEIRTDESVDKEPTIEGLLKMGYDAILIATRALLPKDIATTRQNTIPVNPLTYETSKHGVFAGGNVVTGTSAVIDEIITGKVVATSIDDYIKGA